MRILCLHGSSQTGDVFRERLSSKRSGSSGGGTSFEGEVAAAAAAAASLPDVRSGSVSYVYPDGPIVLPLAPGNQIAMRSWFASTRPQHADSSPDGRELDEPSETCVCKSVEYLKNVWRRYGPFDGVIGFSAGALMASVLCLLPELFPISFAVIVGCPNRTLCDHIPALPGVNPPPYLRTLHVLGSEDTLVPPAESEAWVERLCFPDPAFLRHGQGHVVPGRSADLKQLASWVVDVGMSVREELRESQVEEAEALAAIFGDDFATSTAGSAAVAKDATNVAGVAQGFGNEESGFGVTVWRIRIAPQRVDAGDGCPWAGASFHLIARIGPTYPSTIPHIYLEHNLSMREFPSHVSAAANSLIQKVIAESLGAPMLYSVASAVTQFLEEEPFNLTDAAPIDGLSCDSGTLEGDTAQEEEDLSVTTASSTAQPFKSKSSRGHWRHTIGLIGKPSAGKSTFFNAAARSPLARVAPHPFTTIDPQRAGAWWELPAEWVPTQLHVQQQQQNEQLGHGDRQTRWLMPCWIKDVAGLVPGACEGRGRGNAFLNDLCDADVLLHVVDGSGLSDDDGNILSADLDAAAADTDAAGGGGADSERTDPLHDVRWIAEELRRWVLGNLERKWDGVMKRPSRLPGLFTGYQCPLALVHECVREAGIGDPATLAPQAARTAWAWPRAAERVVDVFLRRRFPMLVVLNKVDLPGAAERVARTARALRDEGGEAVPVCAAAEAWLQAQARAGKLVYTPGDGGFGLIVVGGDGLDAAELARAERVLAAYGSTGVLKALTTAVMLRPPVVCFPVKDLDTLQAVVGNNGSSAPIDHQPGEDNDDEQDDDGAEDGNGADAETTQLLRDLSLVERQLAEGAGLAKASRTAEGKRPSENRAAPGLSLKPGTTVTDVFDLIRSLSPSTGSQFVRAEAQALDGSGRRPVKKEAEIEWPTSVVLRIWSNRRSRWQKGGGKPKPSAAGTAPAKKGGK
ncbi:P-loop containing nucleoside triphosphate hydrolase protein [Zopfochytrium polystomum]|nr:P-loop containing nucleoside triphosphate hydrolase protein [Zopfochytrium polystomum]